MRPTLLKLRELQKSPAECPETKTWQRKLKADELQKDISELFRE